MGHRNIILFLLILLTGCSNIKETHPQDNLPEETIKYNEVELTNPNIVTYD